MHAQVGPSYDYVMLDQYSVEANDDQVFWTFPALSALEQGLPALPCPPSTNQSTACPTRYLNLVTNVFQDFVGRWTNDSDTCGGGLRWQFRSFMAGYDYKNSVSNGGFFNVAARLARYTGNTTYAIWAERIFEWEQRIGLIGPLFHVFDGAHIEDNCTTVDAGQWSYNSALFLHGAAAMYSYTNGSSLWAHRVGMLLNATQTQFFTPYANASGVMYEYECERAGRCDEDQLSFKAYLARSMGKAAVLAPFLQGQIRNLLSRSAVAASRSCVGGVKGTSCGAKWYVPGFDGNTGLGQELSALETVQALLAESAPAPRRA